MQESHDEERSRFVREAAFDGLSRVGARGDSECIKEVLKGLLHHEAHCRQITVDTVKMLAAVPVMNYNQDVYKQKKKNQDQPGGLGQRKRQTAVIGDDAAGKADCIEITVDLILQFLREIMERAGKPAKLQVCICEFVWQQSCFVCE